MPRLSYHEGELLDLLRDLARQKGFAFPRHAKLAERLHCCEKTIRRRLETLAIHGLISWSWTGRSNHYHLAPGSDCPPVSVNEDPGAAGDPLANLGPSGDIGGHGDTTEPRCPPGEANSPQDVLGSPIGKTTEQIGKSTDRPQDMSKRDSKESSSSAAAAADRQKIEETLKQFSSLGVPPETIRGDVKNDPALAAVVVEVLQHRLKRDGLQNPIGFVKGAFKHPEKYSIVEMDEGWRGPSPPRRKEECQEPISWTEQNRRMREEAERNPPKLNRSIN